MADLLASIEEDSRAAPMALPDFTAVDKRRSKSQTATAPPSALPDFTAVDHARRQAKTAPAPQRKESRARRPPSVLLGTTDGEAAAWALSEQPNAFLIALGSSGSGKTELLKVLAHELAGRVPVIGFDFHGDLRLGGLKRISLGAVHGVNPLASGGEAAEALRAVLSVAAPGLGHLQAQLLNEALCEVLKGSRPTMQDFVAYLKRAADGDLRSSARRLLAALQSVFHAQIFNVATPLDVSELIEHGASLDLSKLPRNVQIVAAGALLTQIFFSLRARGAVERPGALRAFLVLDEASLLQDGAFIDPLARESRKFGLGFAVATQDPRELSRTLLANAATAAVFRLQHRAEAERASRLLPQLPDAELLQQLAPRGECYFRDCTGLRKVQILAASRRMEGDQ